jgi:hypothetical protein
MNYSEHKVDDALQGLLQATEAAVQARTGPGPTLEDVRDGDLVPLARAIRNLVERQARTRASSARWASALAEAHAAIEAQLQDVAVAALANRDELAEARRSLEVIRTYLRGEARKDEFAPVLEQLVIALSQRIDDAARTLLPIEQAQARLQAEGGRIGRIGAALRAAGADAPP